jgi:hypothetical protein
LPNELTQATKPNEVWCVDFKGQFRLGNGKYCYPLTITDLYSRFLIACTALENTKGQPALWCFRETFLQYGLPAVIRSDNGSPFASTGLAGLTALSAFWLRLGIRPEKIEPSHPEQNGAHERMHLTLKIETTRPAGGNRLQQQERFDRFRREFNEERPHEALGLCPPASRFTLSERRISGADLPTCAYPLHDLTRVVTSSGHVALSRKDRFFLGHGLAGHPVGLREIRDDYWLISFMHLDLGYFDGRARRFEHSEANERPGCGT